MVCLYGMSEKLGKVFYKKDSRDYDFSQKTYELIDAEVLFIIEESYKKVVSMIKENKDKLIKLAEAVLEKETLFAEEVYELLGITPRTNLKLT